MEDNRRGFHNPERAGHDHNRGGASGGERSGGSKKAMAEPTVHGGHTYEMARRHEHLARWPPCWEIERTCPHHDIHRCTRSTRAFG